MHMQIVNKILEHPDSVPVINLAKNLGVELEVEIENYETTFTDFLNAETNGSLGHDVTKIALFLENENGEIESISNIVGYISRDNYTGDETYITGDPVREHYRKDSVALWVLKASENDWEGQDYEVKFILTRYIINKK